jgi:hypothetical protein
VPHLQIFVIKTKPGEVSFLYLDKQGLGMKNQQYGFSKTQP